MRKLIFTFLSVSLLSTGAYAQYCGSSGSSECTPSGNLTEPGLSPNSDSLPSVVNGVAANTVIQFKNFNQFTYSGILITINSLKIDSIGNLPDGLCWSTNKTNNTFANQEDGCIKVNGTTCSNPGQYKLKILVTAETSIGTIGPNLDAETVNLKYFVRVINSGDAEVAVDTNQTQPFNKPAGYSASIAGCNVGIEDQLAVNALSVVPNPFNSKAVVSFYSEKSGVMTERITNMLGSQVYRNKLNVVAGENTSIINKADLPAGVYFYSISDGKVTTTKRVVITE